MSFEGPPPNSFRATVRAGARRTPLTAVKKPRKHASVEGLGAVPVARQEQRRSNQRGGDRHRLDDNQAVVRVGRSDQKVELINLSRGGAMVAGKLRAKLWDRVQLVLGEFGTVECIVRWIRDNRFGLEFAHETHIDCDLDTKDKVLRDVIRNCFPDVEPEALDGQADHSGSERAKRHPLIWSGILHHDYETDVVRLRNISAGGALIDCSTTLPAGATVFIELDRIGQTAATVCWSRGGQSGLKFEEPFDLYRLTTAEPELASVEWVQPDYLNQGDGAEGEDDEASPWADRWGRLTLSELKYTLRG